jgi:hypothetical protein
MRPFDPIAYRAFAALSRIRRMRIFHPEGEVFESTIRIDTGGGFPAGIFAEPGEQRAVVRLSRGAGLPGGSPDVLGIAIRAPDAYGAGRHQDVLTVSSGEAPVLRHAILPGLGGFFKPRYSSVAPFETPAGFLMLGVKCQDSGPSPSDLAELRDVAEGRTFELAGATLTGRWQRFGELTIGRRSQDPEVESIRFNPWNTSDELKPRGPLMRLRDPAYRGSQAGREASA